MGLAQAMGQGQGGGMGQGKLQEIVAMLMPETTPEEETQKLLLKNYWENSQEFEIGHTFLGLITSALGMSEDEVDDFFRIASTL